MITLPESGNHILDIRPVLLLTEKEREDDGFLILGWQKVWEAGEVVRSMVDEAMPRHRAFDWNGTWISGRRRQTG